MNLNSRHIHCKKNICFTSLGFEIRASLKEAIENIQLHVLCPPILDVSKERIFGKQTDDRLLWMLEEGDVQFRIVFEC